jgi:O-antigen/teichoic acid export membrane protein
VSGRWRPPGLPGRGTESPPRPAPEFTDGVTDPPPDETGFGLTLRRAVGSGLARATLHRPAANGSARPASEWTKPASELTKPVLARSTPMSLGGKGAAADTRGSGKLAEVARGGTLNLLGALFSAVTTLLVTVLVTRSFSRPVVGAFFSATSLFLIVESVTSLGAYAGSVYFIARLRLLGEDGRIKTVLRAAIIPVVVASVTAAVALLIFASPLSRVLLGGYVGKAGASPSAMAVALRALAITLPFAAVMDTVLGAARGFRNMRPSNVVNQFGRSVLQTTGVGIAAAIGSTALLAPLWALPYIPAAAAGWIWLQRIRRKNVGSGPSGPIPPGLAALLALSTPVPVRADDSRLTAAQALTDQRVRNVDARLFWRFTTPRALAVSAQIIVQRLDIVLVGILRGPVDAAIYTAATRFLVVGQLGNIAISQAAQPQFTELFAMGARDRVNAIYRATTAWVIVLLWPLYLLILVNGRQFLAIFGRTYAAGTTVLIILGISMLLSSACGQVDVVLITAGRSSWSLVNGLIAMVVNVTLDLLLIPRYGITGAAVAWAVAIAVANLMPLIQIAITARLFPFGRAMAVACGLTLVCFCAIPLAVRVLLGTGVAGMLCGAAAGAVAMVAGLWYFREPLRLSVMPGMPRFVSDWAST